MDDTNPCNLSTTSSLNDPLLNDNNNDNDNNYMKIGSNKKIRLTSLDILRGLTICFMIFVDFTGDSNPSIDHIPWNGIALADFVMPSFNFMVGISLVHSMRSGRFNNKKQTKFQQLYIALQRTFKLFVIGILTQAGTEFPTYDLKHLRIMGILQRVALCYLTASVCEILLPESITNSKLQPLLESTDFDYDTNILSELGQNHYLVHWYRRYHWLCIFILILIHSCIIYLVDGGCGIGNTDVNCNAASYIDSYILGKNHMYFPMNGGNALEKDMTFQRLSECSTCSPGKCIPPDDAPEWCGYNSIEGGKEFDPEGLVSTLSCVCSSIFGAIIGVVGIKFEQHSFHRLSHWLILAIIHIILGLGLHYAGISMNTNLYSTPYMLVTNGTTLLLLTIISSLYDDYIEGAENYNTSFVKALYKKKYLRNYGSNASAISNISGLSGTNSNASSEGDRGRDTSVSYSNNITNTNTLNNTINTSTPTILDTIIGNTCYPLIAMGKNAILMYLLACTDILPFLFSLFYWDRKECSLYYYFWPTGQWWGVSDDDDNTLNHNFDPTVTPTRTDKYPDGHADVLLWCLLGYIPFFALLACYLDHQKYYFKV